MNERAWLTERFSKHRPRLRSVAYRMLGSLGDADDWQERLSTVPNHRDNWGLVQFVCLSTDEQLRERLMGAG